MLKWRFYNVQYDGRDMFNFFSGLVLSFFCMQVAAANKAECEQALKNDAKLFAEILMDNQEFKYPNDRSFLVRSDQGTLNYYETYPESPVLCPLKEGQQFHSSGIMLVAYPATACDKQRYGKHPNDRPLVNYGQRIETKVIDLQSTYVSGGGHGRNLIKVECYYDR